jgi:hypothetical protein
MEEVVTHGHAESVAPVQNVLGSGQSNFKAEEDLKLTIPYTIVASNAAVGTDQDCSTFWSKIRDIFFKKGGGVESTPNSLQNRFNKVLSYETQKFVGFLQASLREYRSGWNLHDYVTEAKKQFQSRMKKMFKHELVYDILKKDMPKFQLDLSSIDDRVCCSVFLLDSDAEIVAAAAAGTAAAPSVVAIAVPGVVAVAVAPRAGGVVPVVLASSLLTPRPSIGKRKAKELEFQRQQSTGKKGVAAAPAGATVVQISVQQEEDARRSSALNRLAAAAEAQNLLQDKLQQDNRHLQEEQVRLQQEQMCMQAYLQDPTSDVSKAYFHALGQRYSQVFAPPVVYTDNLSVNTSTNNTGDDKLINSKVVVSPLSVVADVAPPASVVVVKLEKNDNCSHREVYHYDSNDSDDDIVVLKTTIGKTRGVMSPLSTVVVVKLENKHIPARRQVYHYDTDASDDDIVVLGSNAGTLPDTQGFAAALAMATMYGDLEETTLETHQQCYAWRPRPPVLDLEKLLKNKNDFATKEESSDEESD